MDITVNSDGGVLKYLLKAGNGTDKPHKGCRVFVHYTGTLDDGRVFDKTNDAPFQFTLGKGLMILLYMTCKLLLSWIFFCFRHDHKRF